MSEVLDFETLRCFGVKSNVSNRNELTSWHLLLVGSADHWVPTTLERLALN